MDAWVESEVVNSKFPDKRLKTRFAELLSSLGKKIGDTIPTACVDWAATEAAYRFLSNARVDENGILSGHFAATASRFSQTAGTVLVLRDTTEFSFQRDSPEKIGKLNVTHTRHREASTRSAPDYDAYVACSFESPLIPHGPTFGEQTKIVVMHNLSSHKVTGAREAIEAVGAELRYLPPYSPDLNPIELAFSKLKKVLRDGAERTVDKLWELCGNILEQFTEMECRNYFKHCGYRHT
jgi:transposase